MSTSSLTKQWRDDFITELRLRGASGRQIGDELALVESHCLDAGAEVEEAFGDPVDYARSVVVSEVGGSRLLGASFGRSLVLRTVVQTIGLMALLNVVPALREGREVTFTGVDVILVLVLAALVVVLVAKSEAVMRYVVRGSVLKASASVALVTGLLVLVGLLPSVFVLTLPTIPVGLVGAALLVVPSFFGWPPEVDGDAIVEPLAEEQPPTSRDWSTVVLQWFVPLAAVVMCAVRWWVP